MRGGREYVIEKNPMSKIKKLKRIFTVRERNSATKYKKKEILHASLGVMIPFGIGRYGFDKASSFQSVA